MISGKMKRFACHKLFLTPMLTYTKSVVEVSSEGLFAGHFALTEEIQGTEWRGGVIFLSTDHQLSALTAQEAWHAFHLMSSENSSMQSVWHIEPFNFRNNSCTPASKLTRLL
ncbi:MAG: hypothetical protein ACRC3Z_07325 [Phocaeicola sp.]